MNIDNDKNQASRRISRREQMEEEEKERLIVSKVFNNLNLLMSTTHKSMGLSANASPLIS